MAAGWTTDGWCEWKPEVMPESALQGGWPGPGLGQWSWTWSGRGGREPEERGRKHGFPRGELGNVGRWEGGEEGVEEERMRGVGEDHQQVKTASRKLCK